MVLTKPSTLFLILMVTTCLTAIRIKTTEPEYTSHYVEATVNILTSCYANRGHATVFVGDLPENLLTTLMSRQPIPTVLLPTLTSKTQRVFLPLHNRMHRLQNFVIVASSWEQVLLNIKNMKQLPWWNHMGSFLIVIWSPNADGTCRSDFANQILFGVWLQDLLHAKLLCYNPVIRKMFIYGYNPHTNEAPSPWQRVNTWLIRGRSAWSLFYRIYEKDGKICDHLDFDKTKDLGGHEVQYFLLTDKDSVPQRFTSNNFIDGYIFYSITRVLNATATVQLTIIDYSARQPYRNLAVEVADVCLNPTEQYYNGLPALYPIIRHRLHIITQYPGHKTQLQKILGVVDFKSQLGVYSVLFITVLFFKFNIHQELVPSILNVVRIVCNTGFENIPRNLATRLYLTAVLLFAVTMQGIYQGQIASLLTTNVSLPVVNSIRDLAESDHTIYGFSTYIGYFDDPKFQGRYIKLDDPNCTKYVIRDALAACIHFDEKNLIKDAQAYKFHVSTEAIATLQITWLVRNNWPLKEKFDKIGMSLFEADITIPFHLRVNKVTAADFTVDDYVKNNKIVRVMTMMDLRFAFVILAIGLTLASITFIAEIAIARCSTTHNNNNNNNNNNNRQLLSVATDVAKIVVVTTIPSVQSEANLRPAQGNHPCDTKRKRSETVSIESLPPIS